MEVRAVPVFANYTLEFALQLRKKPGLGAKGRTNECIVRGRHEEKPLCVKLTPANQLQSR
jgi:hypothetical protein